TLGSHASGTVTDSATPRTPHDYGSGGLVGFVDGNLTIMDSYSTGDAIGPRWTGGLVGYVDTTATIASSFSLGHISGEDFVGGLAGAFGSPYVGTVTDSYATGNVTGRDAVGGLVGFTSYPVVVTRSFTTGNVTGRNAVGGLVGDAGLTSPGVQRLFDSYSTGDVTGADSVGGLFGASFGQQIESSYALGEVTGTIAVGPLIGLDFDTGTFPSIHSFGLEGRSNCDTGPVNVCATAAELRSQQFLSDDNGWDFESVWCIRSSMNGGFPVLRTISFGPGDTNNCRSRSGRVRREVTLDPAGGTCGEHSAPWTIGFRGSLLLPTTSECTRSGHVFLGWTRDPSRTSIQDLLTSSVSRSGSLTAVWGALPPAPASVAALANAWCLRCTSVLLIWDTPSEDGITSDVSLDGAPAECTQSGALPGIEFCLISGLVSGSSHTVSVAWRNEYGLGPAGTVSFSLN
ncbi:MAG: hypothetical protein ACKOCK_07440, partial [Chloroflexota bacterium]